MFFSPITPQARRPHLHLFSTMHQCAAKSMLSCIFLMNELCVLDRTTNIKGQCDKHCSLGIIYEPAHFFLIVTL